MSDTITAETVPADVIEDAYEHVHADPRSTLHERITLRVARIALRRRDLGLSYNAEAIERGLDLIYSAPAAA